MSATVQSVVELSEYTHLAANCKVPPTVIVLTLPALVRYADTKVGVAAVTVKGTVFEVIAGWPMVTYCEACTCATDPHADIDVAMPVREP
jgi:hypothetical protein